MKQGIALKACKGGDGSVDLETIHASQVVLEWGFEYVKYDAN